MFATFAWPARRELSGLHTSCAHALHILRQPPGDGRLWQLRACPRSQALCGARNCCLRSGKPGSARREQLRLMPRKARLRAARATMTRKCFGTRSRNGVETPKPVATSTAAAQPLISRQLATPRTAFRSKPRCLDPPMSRKPTFRHNSQDRELHFALNRDTASPEPRRTQQRKLLSRSRHYVTAHRRFAASRDAANSQRRGKHSPSDSTRQFAGSNALFGRSGMNFQLCSTC